MLLVTKEVVRIENSRESKWVLERESRWVLCLEGKRNGIRFRVHEKKSIEEDEGIFAQMIKKIDSVKTLSSFRGVSLILY